MSKSIEDFKYKKGHYAHANTWNLGRKKKKKNYQKLLKSLEQQLLVTPSKQ